MFRIQLAIVTKILFLFCSLGVVKSSVYANNDFTTPTVTSVEVPDEDYYREGDDLVFIIRFSEAVDITGTPSLVLDIGGIDRDANYSSGTGADQITFIYTVQSGDLDEDGIVIDPFINLNGGTIKDLAGDDADLTLNGIGNLESVIVDAVIPEIVSIDLPPNKTYIEGENLDFVVNYSELVRVPSAPKLDLNIGGSTESATYTGGLFEQNLSFTYTVKNGDEDLDGIEVISLEDGRIQDFSLNNADRTLGLTPTDTENILVEAAGPDVISVTGPIAETYILNEGLIFTVEFDEEIFITGSPQLSIELESGTVIAEITGTGTTSLTFTYTVEAGHEDTDGIELDENTALSLNGGSIEDQFGNSAILTLFGIADLSTMFVDGIVPVVTSVDVPADGTYPIGSTLDFTVNFDDDVVVTGSPQLSIVLDSGTETAVFTGSSPTGLTFSYTVTAGHEDVDGIEINSTGLSLNGGTIQDVNGNDADLTLNNTTPTDEVLVDGVIATIVSVSVPSDDTYSAGEVLTFDVEFSEDVQVAGTPQLEITLASGPVDAEYVSGDDSKNLIFTYTVTDTDLDLDGITLNLLDLNSGTIIDGGGNDADLTLNNVAPTGGVLVNGLTPVITSVDLPPAETYGSGQDLEFQVVFNVPVEVTGSPELLFEIGTQPDVAATLTGGSGTTTLTFSYTVQVGEQDLDGIEVNSLNLNGVTIKSTAGTDADLTLNNIEDVDVFVDAVLPVVQSVAVPAADTYIIDEVLTFTVSFDKIINVSGTPLLSFKIGSSTVEASYLSGSGSEDLVFAYTVQVGEEDTDGISITSPLDLDGGSIEDDLGNPADLTLNGIGPTGGVLVDGIVPVITSVNVPSDDTYMIGESLDFTVNFDDDVNISGSPILRIQIGSTIVDAGITGGSGSTALTFSYTIIEGIEDVDGITVTSLDLNGGTIKDINDNDADLTINNVDPTIVLVDGVKPEITISTISSDPTNDDPIVIEVTFSESVTGFAEGGLTISGGTSSNFSGTGDSYTFDLSPDADGIITIDIAADLAFDTPGNGNQASDQFQIESDMIAPTGYTVSMDLGGELIINTENQSSIAFSITGGEVGATLSYEFEDINGSTITGTETVTSASESFDSSGAGYDLSSLVNGDIILTISLTDPAGNVGADASTTESKDVSPPTGYSIVWNDDFIGAAESASTTFTLNDGEENATLAYSITSSGGGSIGPFSIVMDATNSQVITVDVSSLADGELTIEGQLTDTENNAGVTVSDDGTFLDQTAPNFINITDAGDGNYRAGETITLIADLGESGLTLTGDISVYDGSFGTSVAFTDQTDGTYQLTTNNLDLTDLMVEGAAIAITISATDEAGNETTDNSFTLLLDKTAPAGYTVAFDELLYELSNQDNASFTLTDGEIGSTYNYEISSSVGTEIVSGSGTVGFSPQQVTGIDLTNLQNGDLLLSVTLTDISGNNGNPATFSDSEKIASAPVITPSQVFNVDENSSNGTSVGTVAATDPASLTLFDWTIVSGNDDGLFNLDQTSGELTILDNSTLDFEVTESYDLTITVSNGFVTSDPEIVTININNLNDNVPVVGPSQNFSVDENAPNSTVVGTITASDADAGTAFADWSIIDGNDDGILALDPNTGTLTIADNTLLDFENIQSLTITVSVSDGTNTSQNESVSVSINDLNDNIPVITPDQEFIVPVPITAGTSIGFIEATDGDAGTIFSNWTIVGGFGQNLFSLNSSTGEITLVTVAGLNRTSYSLDITVSDGLNTSSAESITILIGDTSSPVVVLSSQVSGATNEAVQLITATFNEEIVGLEESEISVTNGTISNLNTSNDISFTFEVTASNEGTIEVFIAAGVVVDRFNNLNLESNLVSYNYDITPPIVTLTSENGSLTDELTSEITITFSELVSGFSSNDFVASNAALSNFSGSDTEFTFSCFSSEGIVEITFPQGSVSDLAGNENEAAIISWTIDRTAPESYEVNILNEAINTLNQENLRFEIINGEPGTNYSYTISGGSLISGTGVIENTSTLLEGVDVTDLIDGILTLSVTLTDEAGNSGEPATDETIKNTSVEIPQGFNPNKERWIIPGIENYPDNKVVIFNRFGTKLWEIKGYDNGDKSWDGNANVSGVVGSGGAPDGTYFYVLEFSDGALPSKSGFVIIKR